MRRILALLERAAPHDTPILITGEVGTGTSALARLAHKKGARAHKPLTIVHCPTQGENLVEAASGGTLLFEEISELRPALQLRLTTLLARRHGEVRLLATSHRDLRAEAVAGRFREDLLFRINTIELNLPPLRERKEDIVPLARHFLVELGAAERQLTRECERMLTGYAWPGNQWELRNAIEHALIREPGSQKIHVESLPERIAGASDARPFLGGDFSLAEIENEHLRRVVDRHQRLEEAARVLGIDASTLWRKRKRLAS